MPLTIMEAGHRVRLVAINAGHGLRMRLAELGLVPGVEFEIISSNSHGPCILGVKGSRVVLGHGMAMKIDVQ